MEEQLLWELEFWKNKVGNCPVEEVMRDIRRSNPRLYEDIYDKIVRFSRDWPIRDFLRSTHVKYIQDKLMEYRITAVGQEFRMLGIVRYPLNDVPRLLCFHAFLKKSGKMPKRELKLALERLKQYKGQK